jgi:signal transduction histidine kinase
LNKILTPVFKQFYQYKVHLTLFLFYCYIYEAYLQSAMNKSKNTIKSNDLTDNLNLSLLSTYTNQLKEVLPTIPEEFEDIFWWSGVKYGKDTFSIYSSNIKKVIGYSGEQIQSLPEGLKSLVVREDVPSYNKAYDSLSPLRKTNFFEHNFRIKSKDNKILWLKEKVVQYKNVNGILFLKASLIDITEFKERENELFKSVEDKQNKIFTRDNFLSVLSHDLRAPFSSILGFTEVLMNDPNLNENDRNEYLNFIHDSASNQLQLINYLLDWSNMQIGRLNPAPQRIQAQSIVFNCISNLTGNAIRKNIEIKSNVPESIYIEADERLILQALTNLVSNAIKFSTEGKSVSITVDRFNQEMVEFVVIDEGVGIPESNQSKIFKFEKLFSTRGTKGEKGTGLGLSLVREIVERHGGQVWFYSKEGKGSEFHFTVPSAENSILLVENNKEDYFRFERMIKEQFPQFKVYGADNGFEAINYVLRQHPSVIISSHELPLMNGVQFIKSIIRGDKRFNTPVIALINSYDEDVIKSYQEIGVKIILTKPVDPDKLTENISLCIN